MTIQILHHNHNLVSPYFTEYTQSDNPEIIVSGAKQKLPAEVLQRYTKLQYIIQCSNGIDNIDTAYCTKKGIQIFNAPTANINATAEHAVALMLALLRHIPAANADVRAGNWHREQFVGKELSDLKVGIVGFGKVGQLVYKKLQGFEPEFFIYDQAVEQTWICDYEQCSAVSFEELLSQSDIITIHLPLMDETRHLFSEKEFAKMKDGALLINTARGGIIDEEALLRVLKTGKISAALDVFPDEPNVNPKFIQLNNVILSPHIASMTEGAQRRMIEEAKEHFERAIAQQR
ncbi:MAG: hypothetical protein HYV32_00040 [Candidatus Kerfeldbacteria bacterium]|nr:hypothetical protein [Candidatus Kerfeldbacteria bacterium]